MKKKIFPLSKVYQLIEPGPVVMVSTLYKGKPNIMTMSWHMMIEFEPPQIACIIGQEDYSFTIIKKTKECVINIPTVELIHEIVGVGNCTGAKVDKFKKFALTPVDTHVVKAPLIAECYANLACKVIDTRMVNGYNMFILEVIKAWITPSKKRQRTVHHAGYGVFIVDGKVIRVASKKK
ncbi:MAG: flavin reductase family protein [Candidatus Babeliales bacterium]